MLSKGKYLGDITAATDIQFELLLHLFLSTNMIKYALTSMVNWYTVSLTNLMEVTQSVTAMGLFNMEVTTSKYKV